MDPLCFHIAGGQHTDSVYFLIGVSKRKASIWALMMRPPASWLRAEVEENKYTPSPQTQFGVLETGYEGGSGYSVGSYGMQSRRDLPITRTRTQVVLRVLGGSARKSRRTGTPHNPRGRLRSHVETLIIYKLGFSQNYYTFAFILLTQIVLCSKFR